MTRLKIIMHGYKIPRYKAHRALVLAQKKLKEWRRWRHSKAFMQMYLNELCKVIAGAVKHEEER